MSVTFRTQGTKDVLHLNNWNTRPLLDVFSIDYSKGLNGEIKLRHLIKTADRYLKYHPVDGGRPPIDWSVDPEIGDIGEGVRRLRSLANRSKVSTITYR